MSLLIATCLTLVTCDGAAPESTRATVLVVVGTPGTPDYERAFAAWSERWQAAANQAAADCVVIGGLKAGSTDPAEKPISDHDQLRDQLAKQAKTAAAGPLWLILIGHGSFDGREAKFNLRGPDVTDTELADWLKPITRPVALLDCSSSSGPFLKKLSAPNRVVITATKSGAEQNYARLGQYLAEAWTDPHADLDKDGQTSLLEAFLIAAKQTNEFYKSKARLSTEHALIDDNADGRGTPADWFEGVRLIRKPQDGAADGRKANQFLLIRNPQDRQTSPETLQRRNELELQVAELQDRKSILEPDDYYRQLETLMIDLAHTYDESTSKTEVPR